MTTKLLYFTLMELHKALCFVIFAATSTRSCMVTNLGLTELTPAVDKGAILEVEFAQFTHAVAGFQPIMLEKSIL